MENKIIEFTQEQYICLDKDCGKKFYINIDDQPTEGLRCCCFCGLPNIKNIRKVVVIIKLIEDHKE